MATEQIKTMPIDNMRRVYVFSVPVRIFHWVNAASILALIITGFLISDPPSRGGIMEAYESFWFGKVRFIHFAVGFVFFFNFLFRIYWGLVSSNRFDKWFYFIPISKNAWKEFFQVIKSDILLIKGKPHMSIGHNTLAGVTYLGLFILVLIQATLGFGIYAQMSTFWFAHLFDWVVPFMGGDMAVRHWHHIFTWLFIIFIIIHVYLVFYHDYVEGRGELSSMGGGWKFIEKETVEERIKNNYGK
jgi:Ni/Fe-hydrogenase 1 B-type cytochrome subunit